MRHVRALFPQHVDAVVHLAHRLLVDQPVQLAQNGFKFRIAFQHVCAQEIDGVKRREELQINLPQPLEPISTTNSPSSISMRMLMSTDLFL